MRALIKKSAYKKHKFEDNFDLDESFEEEPVIIGAGKNGKR